ncbi:MAG: hypothetical protein K1W38_20750 [Lachnospiraceae bacterium]|jgi:hypothetical protein
MKVFGYSVTGSKRAVLDVMNINDKGYELNFESFNTGDIYWAENGEGFRVSVIHEKRKIILKEEDQANISYEELYDIN